MFDNISLEKIKKYGNPKRNLIITAFTIIFIAILTIILLFKSENKDMTENYASFYPASTSVYVDINLNDKNIKEINQVSNLHINGISDILSHIFSDIYRNKNQKQINKLIFQTFENNPAFGIWSDNNNQAVKRSLFIVPIKREIKIRPLFQLLFGSNKKLTDKEFKGYKITTSFDKKGAFTILGNKLFLADSYETLVFIIKNYLVGNSDSLYDRKDVIKALHLLEKKRIGTIIFTDLSSDLSNLNVFAGKKYDIKQVTAISILQDKNRVYFNSYTPLNFSQIKDKLFKKACKEIFKNHSSINFIPDFLPINTISFMSINRLSDYINFALELSGLKPSPEYEEGKNFIKMVTSLDFDKDILDILNKNTVFAAVDTGEKRPAFVVALPCGKNTNYIISRLVKLIPAQDPSAEISKITCKNLELGLISSRKFPVSLVYGQINPDLFVIGEKSAVVSIIDTSHKNKTNVADTGIYKNLIENIPANPRILVYMNMNDINRINKKQKLFRNITILNKIANNTRCALFIINTSHNIIKGSLMLNLK